MTSRYYLLSVLYFVAVLTGIVLAKSRSSSSSKESSNHHRNHHPHHHHNPHFHHHHNNHHDFHHNHNGFHKSNSNFSHNFHHFHHRHHDDHPHGKPTNHSINHSTNHSTNHSINHSTNHSINHSTNHTTNHLINSTRAFISSEGLHPATLRPTSSRPVEHESFPPNLKPVEHESFPPTLPSNMKVSVLQPDNGGIDLRSARTNPDGEFDSSIENSFLHDLLQNNTDSIKEFVQNVTDLIKNRTKSSVPTSTETILTTENIETILLEIGIGSTPRTEEFSTENATQSTSTQDSLCSTTETVLPTLGGDRNSNVGEVQGTVAAN